MNKTNMFKKLLLIITMVFLLTSCQKTVRRNIELDIKTGGHLPVLVCTVEKDTVAFLLDTGSMFNIVNKDYYISNEKSFTSDGEKHYTVITVNGKEKRFAHKVSFTFNDSIKVKADVMNINSITDKMSNEHNLKVVGLLGINFFNEKEAVIDFYNNKFNFVEYVYVKD